MGYSYISRQNAGFQTMSQHCDGSRAWVTVDEHGGDDSDYVLAFLYVSVGKPL